MRAPQRISVDVKNNCIIIILNNTVPLYFNSFDCFLIWPFLPVKSGPLFPWSKCLMWVFHKIWFSFLKLILKFQYCRFRMTSNVLYLETHANTNRTEVRYSDLINLFHSICIFYYSYRFLCALKIIYLCFNLNRWKFCLIFTVKKQFLMVKKQSEEEYR